MFFILIIHAQCMDDIKAMILFKPVTGSGGAVRYVSWLAETFDLPLYTLSVEEGSPAPNWGAVDVRTFGRQRRLPILGRRVGADTMDRLEYTFWKPPREFDIVISSGLPTKATMHYPHQTRIHLMHGFHKGAVGLPPRNEVSSNEFLALLQRLNRALLRSEEKHGLERADIRVANSQYTRDAVACYFRETVEDVISPPVDAESFSNTRPASEPFFLYLGELTPYKRVADIVAAFDELPHRLVVAGSGPLDDQLRAESGANVRILGHVSEQRKKELFGTCEGFIQHSLGETFGVTTVEALASGSPVVAVDDGNTPNLVDDGETGRIYPQSDSLEPLREAIREAAATDWDHDHIQSTATAFSKSAVETQWSQLLSGL
jgi:glycosyltransferase involved in cell wall biosynthesis